MCLSKIVLIEKLHKGLETAKPRQSFLSNDAPLCLLAWHEGLFVFQNLLQLPVQEVQLHINYLVSCLLPMKHQDVMTINLHRFHPNEIPLVFGYITFGGALYDLIWFQFVLL